MSTGFDPYHRWLGIPPHEQPADYYRLLGLVSLEDDVEVIRAAAERQMAHVRTYHLGPHAELSQRILNELAAAKSCLLDPQKKTEYDRGLRPPPPVPIRSTRAPGRALVAVGLLLVIAARGCNVLSERAAARDKAELERIEQRLREEQAEGQGQVGDSAAGQGIRKLVLAAGKSRTVAEAKVSGMIEEAGDQDLFVFTAPAAGKLQVDMLTPEGDLDSHLTLLDSGKQVVAENDDGLPDQDSQITMPVEAGKTYYVRAAASPTNTTRGTGPYELHVQIQAVGDDFGNKPEAAHELKLSRKSDATQMLRDWEPLEAAARNAPYLHAVYAYWCAVAFLVGAVCLSVGLLLVGFSGQGSERWICLTIVAIIAFSLFVGGTPWGTR